MRYAVPRIFHNAGLLERFYTDIVAAHGWRQIAGAIPEALQPASLRRLFSRGMEIADLPRERVKTFPLLGLTYAFRLMKGPNADTRTRIHLDVQDTFSRKILKCGLGEATHLYCFDMASLGIMRAVAGKGVRLVMEQTNATRLVWSELVQRERQQHPDWENSQPSSTMDDVVQTRYLEAWTLADKIVCGSEFVREGVARCGGPVSKCTVVPYGVDLRNCSGDRAAWRHSAIGERYARRRAGRPFRVLTVGNVNLNKGAPYVLEAARAFGNRAQFRMVGAVDVSKSAACRLAEYVDLTGLVPRNEVASHYYWADVFLFPSVCEGSATVVYEALAYGLPVICTPNTGSVVKDGVDGFIVEPSSGEAVIAALEKVIVSPERWLTMSQNAFTTSDQMDVKHYGERLLRALGCGDVR